MSDSPNPRQLFATRFELVEKLGEGTVASTWLTRDIIRQEKVVLKIIHDDIVRDAGGFDGLKETLRFTSGFRHPSVLSVFDFSVWDGQVYFSMEAARGRSLRDLIQSADSDRTPIDQRTIARVVLTLLKTIVERGPTMVPHGGIKPENIWIEKNGRVRISEFGINTLAPPQKLRASAAILRTGQYLAPEVYQFGSELNDRTDQFALGTVWSEMLLAGGGKPAGATFAQQRRIIARLTSAKPSERFGAFESALEEVLNQETLKLKPARESIWNQLKLWRIAQVASAIGLGTLAVLFGKSLWQSPGHSMQTQEMRSELRQQIRVVERDRMNLLADGFSIPELREALIRHFSAESEFEILESLGSNPEDTQTWPPLKLQLNSRADSIQLARGAIQGLGTIDEWQRALDRLSNLDLGDRDALQLDILAKRNEAIESFQSGQFRDGLDTTKNAVAKVAAFFRSSLDAALQQAEESREKWKAALEARGTPYAEPIGNPGRIFKEFASAETEPSIADAILSAAQSVQAYNSWTIELEQLPEPSSDSFRNSLGMIFEKVGPIQVSVWETRVIDFHAYVTATGYDANRSWREQAAQAGPFHPVTSIARIDGVGFCEWLTEKEHAMGILPHDLVYALPTDREWSQFAGLDNENGATPFERGFEAPAHFPWESDDPVYSNRGNYFTPSSAGVDNDFQGMKDRFYTTAPVARFEPNRYGLYDVGGNVWEWVSTPFYPEPAKGHKGSYMARGGGWRTINLEQMKTGYRINPPAGHPEIGFRCIIRVINNGETE